MATTIVTRQSFFSRIGNSIKGVFLGIILLVIGIILLFWNESNSVKTSQALREGASSVISVDSRSIVPENEGKLIHFSGLAKTPSILVDSEFGVSQPALKLKRTVEIFQWVENAESKTVEKVGGSTETTTTYTYKKEWHDEIIDSSEFKEQGHTNPTSKLFENQEYIAQNVSVDAFSIPETMISSLNDYQTLPSTEEDLVNLPYDMQQDIQLISGIIYYKTEDPANPQIGNTRVIFQVIPTQTLSVIAQQKGSTVADYSAKNGRTISFIQTGEATADQMFQGAIQNNKIMTWILRIIGILLLFIGFRSIFGLLPIIGAIIPPLGRLIGAGFTFVSLTLALITGLIIISIAWIFARPFIGIGLLISALLLFIFAVKIRGKKK